ncbi:GTP-binding protein REM 1 [Falco biarmicus]|uniref:GTP-binding protein REM 1 n=1 Tax=Falco peregrinus TaxID=8954 RepID=UPI001886A29E|nr:GTP-binding protein REM 1 [Falco peregrinus]XP_027669352.2 GTP-binding protein REM 1 [Falco cherrug]XP_037259251.1 GTP-binding protein REM 1 [Falco rusticolus]XP_056210104.1 GTP-binding protein REM 1 [Falco biarmicus]
MTLNTQRGSRSPLRRRASTPLPRPGLPGAASGGEPRHPQLGQSASEPGGRTAAPRGSWSSESSGSSGPGEPRYRVVLLGDPGVGKTSLVNLFAGVQERDPLEQHREAVYERTLCVDGEETTLLVMDTWEPEQPPGIPRCQRGRGEENWCRSQCLQVGNAYVIVYSITDRSSFESASELRIQLRRARQAEDIPIILVGNKTDLVRCREVSIEEGRACAVVFDCKFIETSAALQHNVAELFEGVVRQIRLRRGGKESCTRPVPSQKRKESLTKRARRFLDRLVARNSSKVALKFRSKSCHDLSVL